MLSSDVGSVFSGPTFPGGGSSATYNVADDGVSHTVSGSCPSYYSEIEISADGSTWVQPSAGGSDYICDSNGFTLNFPGVLASFSGATWSTYFTYSAAPAFTVGQQQQFRIRAKATLLPNSEEATILFRVPAANQAPVLAAIADQTINENQAMAAVNANDGGDDADADGDTITYSCFYDVSIDAAVSETTACTSLSGVSFANGTGVLAWTPGFTQSGSYEFMIKGSDGSLSGSEIFGVTVNNVDRAPVLDVIADLAVSENAAMTQVNAADSGDDMDIDGETISYSCFYDTTVNAAVSEATNCTSIVGITLNAATGTIDWTPSYTQAGTYEFMIKGTAGTLSDTEIFVITVNNVDRAPSLDLIADETVPEGTAITQVNAADLGDDLDVDGDAISYSCYYDLTNNGSVAETTLCTALTGIAFNTTTGVMNWTPAYTQAGTYEFMIKGTAGTLNDTELFLITVNNTDRAPIIDTIFDQTIDENVTIINVNASDGLDDFDVDGDTITYACWYDTVADSGVTESTACTTITGVGFNTSSGQVTWTPNYTQAGVYEFMIKGTANALSDTEVFVITVTNVDRAPVLAAINDETVAENVAITQVNANDSGDDTDADGDAITYTCFYDTTVNGTVAEATTCTSLTGVTFNGTTGVMDWTPDYTQAGVYEFMVKGSEGDLSDTELFVMTVSNADRAPTLAAISDETVAEGAAITQVNANDGGDDADVDGDTITYTCFYDTTVNGTVADVTACTSLSGVSFNGTTGVMDWTPGLSTAGQYEFMIIGSEGDLSGSELFAITVTNSDQPPVIAAINDETVSENAAITAIDANDGGDDLDSDGDTISYTCFYDTTVNGTVAEATACGTLTGVSFTPVTGVMSWTPDYTQAGVYEFMIKGNEGDLTDTELFVITVNNVDRAPALDFIADETVGENSAITQVNAADLADDLDADGDTISYQCWYDTTSNGAVSETTLCTALGATFNTTTGVLNWTPSFAQAGTYEIMIKGDEGDLTDEEIFVITVTNADQAPVLAAIGDETVLESVAITAIDANDTGDDLDADGDTITYTCFYDTTVSGTVAETTSCGTLSGVSFTGATGAFAWTPSLSQAGVYEFMIKGSEGDLSDTEVFVITVTNVDQPPVLAAIADETVNENVAIAAIDANDAGDDYDFDDNAITYTCFYDTTVDSTVAETTACTTLTGLSFTGTTGAFAWTPSFSQSGVYEFMIKGSEGDLSDTELFVITVSNVDQAPALAAISDTAVAEGVAIAQINANDGGDDLDVDGDTITYTCFYDTSVDATVAETTACTTLTGVAFNGTTGVFDYTPNFGSTGVYEFMIKGSEGDLSDTELFLVTVSNTDLAPVIADINDETVNENVAITAIDANDGGDDQDADGDTITYTCFYDTTVSGTVAETTACGSLTGVSFTGTTGAFSWTPDYTQFGVYEFMIKGDEGDLSDTELFVITVNNVDRPPALDAISFLSIAENTTMSQLDAADGGDDLDVDNDTITYTCFYDTTVDAAVAETTACTTLTGISFNTAAGTMDWTPSYTQSGTYEFMIKGTAGSLSDDEIFNITVTNSDRAPLLSAINDETVNEAVAITQVNANDGGDDLDVDGDTIGYQCWYDTASDATVAETTLCTALSGVSFNPTTGLVDWTPDYTQSGTYEFMIKGTSNALFDTELFVITVNNSDRAPVLDPIANVTVNENLPITLVDAADGFDDFDVDGDLIAYSCWYDTTNNGTVAESTLCTALGGVSFTGATGTFTWTPNYTQSGTYEFMIKGSEGDLNDTELFVITVTDVDQLPVLAAIADETVSENVAITQVDANDGGDDFDADGEAITYQCWYDTTSNGAVAETTLCTTLSGIIFDVNTGVLRWTPDYTQDGTYEFMMKATAGPGSDTEVFVITVNNADQAPVLAAIGDETVAEGASITQINANDAGDDLDADGETITYTCFYDTTVDATVAEATACTSLSGVSFNGTTGVMDWTTSLSQADQYEIMIKGTAGALNDTELFVITVTNNDQPPVLAAINDLTTLENLAIAAIDANDGGDDLDVDGDTITYQCWYDTTNNGAVSETTLCTALTGVSFTGATGAFTWTPDYTQAGVYEFMIKGDEGNLSDTELFVVTVNNVDRAPTLDAIADESVAENTAITQVNAADGNDDQDVDGDTISYQCWYDTTNNGSVAETTLCTALTGVTFNTTTGVMDWTPDYTQAGVYEFMIKGTAFAMNDTELYLITVTNMDRAPVLDAIADQSIFENAPIAQVNAADAGDDQDADGDTISYQCWYDTTNNSSVAETTLCTALTGVTFNTTTGVMDWTPDYTQAGVYEFMIKGAEGDLSDAELFVITVQNVNQAPVLATINDQNVKENQAIAQINANDGGDDKDIDGDNITYECWYDNSNDSYVDTVNSCGVLGASFDSATGVLDWTPSFASSAVYEIMIKGSDSNLTDAEFFLITVVDVAPFTWTGATGDSKWSTPGNWTSVPSNIDVAVFDGAVCSTTCNVTIDASVNVKGIDIKAGFAGIITQGAFDLTTGTSGWSQAGGTWSGNNASNMLEIGGPINIYAGATFNCGQSTEFYGGSISVAVGANFNCSDVNDTLRIRGNGTKTINIIPAHIISRFKISNDASMDLDLTNNLVVNNFINNTSGAFALQSGQLIIRDSLDSTTNISPVGGGSFKFNCQSGAGTLNGDATTPGVFPDVFIDCGANSLALDNIIQFGKNITYISGGISYGTSNVKFVQAVASTVNINSTSNLELNNVHFENSSELTISGTGSGNINVNGYISLNNPTGFLQGERAVKLSGSNLHVQNWGGGSARIWLVGTGSQSISRTSGMLPSLELAGTGTITLSNDFQIAKDFFVRSGPSINYNNRIIEFVGPQSSYVENNTTWPVENIKISKTGGAFVSLSGTVFKALNVEHASGALISGTLQIAGNLNISGSSASGGASIEFNGTTVQELTQSFPGAGPDGLIKVTNANSVVKQMSPVLFNGNTQDVHIFNGTWDMNQHSFDLSYNTDDDQSVLTLASGTKWIKQCRPFNAEQVINNGTIVEGKDGLTLTITPPGSAVVEGSNATFNASLSATNCMPTTFTFTTVNNSATVSDGDYTPGSSIAVTIPQLSLGDSFTIPVLADNYYEGASNENFRVSVQDFMPGIIFSGGSPYTVSIIDQDSQPEFDFSLPSSSIAEGQSSTVTVRLDKKSYQEIRINYAYTNNTAEGGDYTINSTSPLIIAPGQTSANISFTAVQEGDSDDEVFKFDSLSPSLGDAALNLSGNIEHTVTISDDEGTPNIWYGTVDNQSWVDGANWSKGHKPTASELVVFNGDCGTGSRCQVHIDETNAEALGITFDASYGAAGGVVYLQNGNTLNVGSSGIVMHAGIFYATYTGSVINIDGSLSVDGGVFVVGDNANRNPLTIKKDIILSGTGDMQLDYANVTINGSDSSIINTNSPLTFNNLNIFKTGTSDLTVHNTIEVAENLTIDGDAGTHNLLNGGSGQIYVNNNLTIGTWTSSQLLFKSSSAFTQVIDCLGVLTQCRLSGIQFGKSAGTVEVMDVLDIENEFTIFGTTTPTDFNGNKIIFSGTTPTNIRLDGAEFGNVEFRKTLGADINLNNNIVVAGKLTVDSGPNAGDKSEIYGSDLIVKSDLDVISGGNGGSQLKFMGNAIQTVTVSAGEFLPGGNIFVEKTAGYVKQMTNISEGSGSLNINQGTWDMFGTSIGLQANSIAIGTTGKLIKNCNSISPATPTGTGVYIEGKQVQLSMNAPSVVEGSQLQFVITSTPANCMASTFVYSTANATAVAPGDYNSILTTAGTISSGSTSTVISVTTQDDLTFEDGPEYMTLNITSAMPGVDLDSISIPALGEITDAQAGPPTISIADVTVNEGDTATFVVSLSYKSDNDVTFNYATSDSATTSTSNVDYTAISSTAGIISAGTTTFQISVNTAADTDYESLTPEYFNVILSSIQNANVGTISAKGSMNEIGINISSPSAYGATATGFTAQCSFSSDVDANAAVTVYYCNQTLSSGCDPYSNGSSLAMTRGTGIFAANVTGLPSSNHTYKYEIRATDTGGVSGSPLTIGTITLTGASAPPNPIGLEGLVISNSDIDLTWNSGGGSTVDYRIAYDTGLIAPTNCSSGTQINESAINGTFYRLSGLTTSTQYSIRLCAINSNSNESSGVTITLNTLGPARSRVFVTSTTYLGNMGGAPVGIAGADANCASRATAGGLTGTYKAIIADGTAGSNPNTRLTITYPLYKRTSQGVETTIANNSSDLWDNTIGAPININEYGAIVSSGFVWTGSLASGTYDLNYHCAAWTSTATSGGATATKGTYGNLAAVNSTWINTTDATKYCGSNSYRLYCVDTAPSYNLPPPPIENLSGFVISPNQISLSWTSGGAPTFDYIYKFQVGNTPPSNCLGGNVVGGTIAAIAGLQSSETYSFKVCARDSNGTHSVGKSVTLTTPLMNGISLFGLKGKNPTISGFGAEVSYLGDDDSNAAVTVYYCNNTLYPYCDPTATGIHGFSFPMVRSGNKFVATISDTFNEGDVLNLQVLAADSPTVTYSPDPLEATLRIPVLLPPSLVEYVKTKQKDTLGSGVIEASDTFGASIVAHGNILIIGAPLEDSAIADNMTNNSSSSSGAVYILIDPNSDNNWGDYRLVKFVKAPSITTSEMFGQSLAFDGKTLAVGTGGSTGSGKVYLYQALGNDWTIGTNITNVSTITPINGDAGDGFGQSIAIDGRVLIVGAPSEDSGSRLTMSDNSSINSGAVYIYRDSSAGNDWSANVLDKYIKAPDIVDNNKFGFSVSLSESAIAVGSQAGDKAYVIWNPTKTPNWSTVDVLINNKLLVPSNLDAGDGFGQKCVIDGSRVACSSPLEDGAGTTNTIPDTANALSNTGAVYVFKDQNADGDWNDAIQDAYLKSSAPTSSESFGSSIAFSGTAIVVGAMGYASGKGAAYVFKDTNVDGSFSTESNYQTITASNGETSDSFGKTCAITDSSGVFQIFVGATGESSSAYNVNDNTFSGSGAVYMFGQ